VRENRTLLNLYQPYKWVVYFPLLGLSTFGLGITSIVLSWIAGPRVAGICGRIWSRLNAAAIPMRVRFFDQGNMKPGQSYVVVSNHQSHLDIFVLIGWSGLDLRWVMKAELRKIPVFGFACSKLGHVYIDRSNREQALATLERAREKIRDGTAIVFFPEGTRSPDGALLPFKKGAFRFALDLGLPILPVTIKGTRDLLPGRSLKLFPGKVDAFVHPPIETTGLGEGDLAELIARTRAAIATPLEGRVSHGGEG